MLLAASAIALSLLTPPRPPYCPDVPAPGTARAGIRVEIDPATGRLRERPARRAEGPAEAPASSRFSKSDANLVEVRLPNGAVAVDVRGRFRSAAVATLDADGTLHVTCGREADHAH